MPDAVSVKAFYAGLSGELTMPRIPQSQSAGALGVGKATSGLQQNGGFVVGDSSRSSRMTWGTIDITSDGPTAAMVKGWPRWAIPGALHVI